MPLKLPVSETWYKESAACFRLRMIMWNRVPSQNHVNCAPICDAEPRKRTKQRTFQHDVAPELHEVEGIEQQRA